MAALPSPVFGISLGRSLDRSRLAAIESGLDVRVRRLDDPRRGIVAQRTLHDVGDRLITLRVRRVGVNALVADIVDTHPDQTSPLEVFTAIDRATALAARLAGLVESITVASSQRPVGGTLLGHRELLMSAEASDVVSDLLPGRVGDRLSAADLDGVKRALLEDIEEGLYTPTEGIAVEHPKPRGGTRPAAALRFSDRLLYAALVDGCRDKIEAALCSSSHVLWPRGVRSDKRWPDLERFVDESEARYIVSVDVQSFYDMIEHSILQERLVSVGCSSTLVDDLVAFLETVQGRRSGLPQGLQPSDPLATLYLAHLDKQLMAAGLSFVRHGDDVRIAAQSLAHAREVQGLVTDHLRRVGLPVNDEKTRAMRRETYTAQRAKLTEAIGRYLSSEGDDRYSAVHGLLTALGAEEDVHWGWYHGNLTVDEVLSDFGPVDAVQQEALLHVLDAVAGEQVRHEKWRLDLEASGNRFGLAMSESAWSFLTQASLGLLAAAGNEDAPQHVRPDLIGRPEYADSLSSYVQHLSEANPSSAADFLQAIERSGVPYDSQWLRLYEAVGLAGRSGDFNDLAEGHVEAEDREVILRIRAGRLLLDQGAPDVPVSRIAEAAAPALRDDVLALAARQAGSAADVLAGEPNAVRALVGAA